ncbi:uncharacterized protein LOC135347372 isoform X2 [Halichondria panicea]|uniref:uncharacterized protein LOC135347372 isoform X2 n=1 Tax=Halichondria panicea TaxID=6063 RepID=UPI00312B6F93
MQSLKPRGPGECPPFEVICVWVAEAVMWVDNIWLALRHWSLHEPIFFTIALALPGLFLSLLGKYIPYTGDGPASVPVRGAPLSTRENPHLPL